MTREEATRAISNAVNIIQETYWAVCDSEESAISVSELGASDHFLDELQAIALATLHLAQCRAISWSEARTLTANADFVSLTAKR